MYVDGAGNLTYDEYRLVSVDDRAVMRCRSREERTVTRYPVCDYHAVIRYRVCDDGRSAPEAFCELDHVRRRAYRSVLVAMWRKL